MKTVSRALDEIKKKNSVSYCDKILIQNLLFFLPFHAAGPTLTLLRGNVGLSAVCVYNMSAVEDVFSTGKYMQKVTVEESHSKWVRYTGIVPSPRPGAVSTSNSTLLMRTE